MNNFDTVREALESVMDAADWGKCLEALTALAAIEADHYSAADMADAQAKAFRSGVASVTAGQEPFAHFVYFPDQQRGEFAHDLDDLCEDMTNDENHEVTPLFTAAPVAQQPQANTVKVRFRGNGNPAELMDFAELKQPQAEAVPPDVVRDAERYRFLRNKVRGWHIGPACATHNDKVCEGECLDLSAGGVALDSAINAAMAQGAKT